MNPQGDSHETFIDAVRPWADHLTAVADAGYHLSLLGPSGNRPPEADSPAMRELAQQGDFAGEWDTHPIDTAYTHVGLLLTAAEDAMLTFAAMVVADRTPIFAFVPVARSAMESLALAHWLGASDIDARERVRRSLNERIKSAYEQSRLPPQLNPEPGRQRRLLASQSLGFKTAKSKRGSLTMLAPTAPSATSLMQGLMTGEQLGKVLYSYMSAITHGTLWGLTNRVDPVEGTGKGPLVTANIKIDSRDIAGLAMAMLLGHQRTLNDYMQLFGWASERLATEQRRAMTMMNEHFQTLAAGKLTD